MNAQDEQAALQHTCVATDPGALYESIAGTGTVISIDDVHMNGDTYANVLDAITGAVAFVGGNSAAALRRFVWTDEFGGRRLTC